MHMKVRQADLDSAEELNVVLAVKIFRQAALDANLGGSALNRFD